MPTLYIQIPAKASFYSLSCWDNFEHRHDSWFYKIVRIISSWRIKDAEQKNFIPFLCKLNVSSIHYKINHLTQKGSDLTEKCSLKDKSDAPSMLKERTKSLMKTLPLVD